MTHAHPSHPPAKTSTQAQGSSKAVARWLLVHAAVAGFVTLALEVTLARLLAPAFGTSAFIWTNVIGVILIGLSLGAYLGGRIADRYPSPAVLGWIGVASAIYILVLPAIASPILRIGAAALTERSESIFLAALLATLALAFPTMVTLGMVSPFVVRLRAHALQGVGRDAGGVSAIATIGSILGTFLPTLWAVPSFGVKITILGLGTFMLLGSLPLVGWRWWSLAVLFPLLGMSLPFSLAAGPYTIAMAESPYQFIAVDQYPDGTRLLRMNEGQAFHSVLNPFSLRSGTIYDAFSLLPAMHRGEMKTMANVGVAGGTIAHIFNQLFPDVRVTGMEIDPTVVEFGKKYFTLNDPNITVITQDGRIALATSDATYDTIVVDAYRQPYIPFHLATREFFELCQRRLAPNGIFAMNVATIDREDPVLTSILNTLSVVFRETWVYAVPDSSNFLVFASDDVGIVDRLRTATVPEIVRDLQLPIANASQLVSHDPTALVLTDDRAPVELFTDRVLLHEATRPGGLQTFPRPD